MLYTDDIQVKDTDGWVEIPLLTGGSYVHVVQIREGVVQARVNSGSTSKGVELKYSDQFKAEESIFLSSPHYNAALVTVIRDGN